MRVDDQQMMKISNDDEDNDDDGIVVEPQGAFYERRGRVPFESLYSQLVQLFSGNARGTSNYHSFETQNTEWTCGKRKSPRVSLQGCDSRKKKKKRSP